MQNVRDRVESAYWIALYFISRFLPFCAWWWSRDYGICPDSGGGSTSSFRRRNRVRIGLSWADAFARHTCNSVLYWKIKTVCFECCYCSRCRPLDSGCACDLIKNRHRLNDITTFSVCNGGVRTIELHIPYTGWCTEVIVDFSRRFCELGSEILHTFSLFNSRIRQCPVHFASIFSPVPLGREVIGKKMKQKIGRTLN